MKFRCINSDSDGNGYVLFNQSEALVLEAGVSLDKLKKALDFNMGIVQGVLFSHVHSDHSKYIKDYIKHFKCCSHADGLFFHGVQFHYNAKTIEPNKLYTIGSFNFVPFELVHDVTTFGFLIETKSTQDNCNTTENICFITDTKELNYNFVNLTQIFVECNYDDTLIDTNQYNGKLPSFLADRIRNSHLSLEQVKEFLLRQDLTKVKNIVLLHLSSRNSNSLEFKKEIENLTGKMVHIADSGMEIDLNGF